MDRLTGHFINNVYDFEGLVLTSYILLAFGLAVLAGLLLRRSIPAMVAALIAWLAVRLTVEYLLRPRFQAPLTHTQSCTHGCSLDVGITSVPPQTGHIGDWVLRATGPGNQIVTTYQPADRFWTLPAHRSRPHRGDHRGSTRHHHLAAAQTRRLTAPPATERKVKRT